MGVITFNSRLSSTFGIQVEQRPNYELPEKDYEIIHVPGKSGDILIDKGSYKNVDRIYNIAIGSKSREFYSMAFVDNCSPITISDGEVEEIHENMSLVQVTKMGNEYWFVIRDISVTELEKIKMQSDIEYLAMMSDIEL